MGKTKPQKNFAKRETKENMGEENRKKKHCSREKGRFQMLNLDKRNITGGSGWSLNLKENVYSEMGCVKLERSESDNSSEASSEGDNLELTPAVTENTASRPVPMAPRILLPSQKENILNTSGENCDLSPQESSPLLRKHGKWKDDSISEETTCNPFLDLSDEILLMIFRWLPKFTLAKCARVCSRWHRLVNDESLWKRLDLSNKTLYDGSMGHVMNKGVQILRLAKSEIRGPVFMELPEELCASVSLSKLQYLDLSMSTSSADVLVEIFAVCRDLKKLSLEHCQLNEDSCSYISENRNLQVLNMCMCEGITTGGLMAIVSNCTKLESLNLAWTGLHRHTVVYLSLCLPSNLTKLNISGCRENITDEEVLQICRTCTSLKELDLSDSTVLTCASVTHIVENLHDLEYLALSRCYRIFPSTLLDLQKMPSILALDVFGVLQEEAFQRLKDGLRHLKINQYPFSSIARPTTGIHRTSLWGLRVRDIV